MIKLNQCNFKMTILGFEPIHESPYSLCLMEVWCELVRKNKQGYVNLKLIA
jgi:hypothetical protein